MPLANGQTFAGYRILRRLGAGAMGEVYLAQHPRLPRQDALKVLGADISSDANYRARFDREADLASTLWHPNIVGVHDRGEDDGQLWISMDYVEGQDAAHLLARQPQSGLRPKQVAKIVIAVASALDYAHQRKLLHRDVKPANIMVTTDEQRILLADFGIARSQQDISGLTATNFTVGTMAYAAPEQLMGKDLDGRADQYALAATAYYLLTGSHLFPHSNPAVVISHHLTASPPALGDIRPELAALDSVLAIALAKNPRDRFRDCNEFARAFSLTRVEPAGDRNHRGLTATRAAAVQKPSPSARPAASAKAPTSSPQPVARTKKATGSVRPPTRAAPALVSQVPQQNRRTFRRHWWLVLAVPGLIIIVVGAVALMNSTFHKADVPGIPPTTSRPVELPFNGLIFPVGVAVDTANNVYVTDKAGGVSKLAVGTTKVDDLGLPAGAAPTGVAVDGSGTVYVAASKQQKVLKQPVGSHAWTDLPFTGLNGNDNNNGLTIAADASGNVFVADPGSKRVLKLLAGSNTPSELPFAELSNPSGIAVNASGDVYVSDAGNNAVFKLSAGAPDSAAPLPFSNLRGPEGVAVDPVGNVYIADSGNGIIELQNGSRDQVNLPVAGLTKLNSLAVDAAGDIFMTEAESKRVLSLPTRAYTLR